MEEIRDKVCEHLQQDWTYKETLTSEETWRSWINPLAIELEAKGIWKLLKKIKFSYAMKVYNEASKPDSSFSMYWCGSQCLFN